MNPGESPDDMSGNFFFPPTKKSKNSPKTIPKKQGIFWIGISEFGQKGTDLEISLVMRDALSLSFFLFCFF